MVALPLPQSALIDRLPFGRIGAVLPALASGINPGINLRTTQETSGSRSRVNVTRAEASDQDAIDLITRRSRVRIPPPLLTKGPEIRAFRLSQAGSPVPGGRVGTPSSPIFHHLLINRA